jgi:hypothetical protein
MSLETYLSQEPQLKEYAQAFEGIDISLFKATSKRLKIWMK